MQEVGYRAAAWRTRIRHEVFALLDFLTTVLAVERIPYFIMNGTLLGAVKFGGIIPWDDDADLGVFLADVPRILPAVRAAIASARASGAPAGRYKLAEVVYGHILSGPDHGMVDLIVFDVEPTEQSPAEPEPVYRMAYPCVQGTPTFISSRYRKLDLPASWLLPLREYDFDGRTLTGPARGEDVCLQTYGSAVFTRNARPDRGWGIHPVMPLLLPLTTPLIHGILGAVDRVCPHLIEKVVAKWPVRQRPR